MGAAREFDPTARLMARNAPSLADLRRQFGTVGRENGPRVGEGRRRTTSNEAYMARRLVLYLAGKGTLSFPITVEHGDNPDFIIWHGGKRVPLEFTEACPSDEGRAMATQGDKVVPVGNYSDTGTAKAMSDFQQQVQEAIDRKRSKAYAAQPNSTLLIYPNSDASFWVKLFCWHRPLPFIKELQITPFAAVYIYWSDKRFFSVKRGQ